MTEDQDQTAGTPEPNDTDALESTETGGTSATDDRNAEPKGKVLTEDQWKEVLQWKAGAEKAKELEARLAEDAAPEPPDTDGTEPKPGTYEWFLAHKDPVAQRVAFMERKLELDGQLATMPADERAAVKEHFRKNHWRLGDMHAARAELNAPKYESELQRLREENERLKRGPDPEVMNAPPTGGREVSARERKSKMTEAQFDQQANQIRASKGELAYFKWVDENAGNIG